MLKYFLIIAIFFVGLSATSQVPTYLKDYSIDYKQNPREANIHWFKNASFGMFIHFGLYSQLKELLTQYPTIAGIWFDPVMGFYANPEVFPMDETYALIRKLSPHALILFKQGANGDEDFMAPERGGNAKVGAQYPVAVKAYFLLWPICVNCLLLMV